MALISFLEAYAKFCASKVIIEDSLWDPKKVLEGGASDEENSRFIAALLISVHSGTVFFWALFYTLLHALVPLKPTLSRWRFQGTRLAPRALIQHAYIYVALMHVAVSLLTGVYFAPWLVKNGFLSGLGGNLVESTPPLHIFVLNLLANLVLTSTTFYWGHWLLHEIPFLYTRVHKRHHLFIVTCSIAAEYAHPIEFVFGNILPVLAGPLLLRQHPSLYGLWLCLALTSTSWSHSGVWYPGLVGTRSGFHDWHHEAGGSQNLGTSGEWDMIMGTNLSWKLKIANEAKVDATTAKIDAWRAQIRTPSRSVSRGKM